MEASYGQPPYCTTGVENFSSSKDKKNNSPNQSLALRSNLPCLALPCLALTQGESISRVYLPENFMMLTHNYPRHARFENDNK